ncbi:hypothetical protein [Stenotrophomonas indicatrix]|uniref:hypothetical protein n=1 Tax=Stenotrophomonas indicatrix TaxID=2045451 RepID=UPI001070B8EC|nr:hypothetical protein [Stenotrophomonas indicatrix]QBR43413.1 hypothetical protein DAIF1_09580 [Stenotrophomonas indicatrix]
MDPRSPAMPSAEAFELALTMLGQEGVDEEQAERALLALGSEHWQMRRLLVWLPEAFAMALIGLPGTFTASDAQGDLHELPLDREPVFAAGLQRALVMYHEGPRAAFRAICQRSSSLNAIDNALNTGADLRGAALSGPELLDIPAETYLAH